MGRLYVGIGEELGGGGRMMLYVVGIKDVCFMGLEVEGIFVSKVYMINLYVYQD